MASATYVGSLDGLYKQVYAKIIEDAVPSAAHLVKSIKFTPKDQQNGLFFNQPVILTQEQGWSYILAGSQTPTLSGNVPMQLKNAQVLGSIIAGQAALTVEAAKRAIQGGPSAFEDAVGLQMRVMLDSGKRRQEINFLYGNTALATGVSSVNSNTHQTVVTITGSQYAAGFWAGMNNAQFDAYYANNTQLNTSGTPLVAVTTNAASNTVTFNSSSTTDISNLDAALAASNVISFYFFGAFGVESNGLKAQLTNQSVLFNIDASVYDLWKGSTYVVPSPGTFSFSQLQKAIAVAVNRGLDEDVTVYVSPATWANLLTDQAALRMYPSASREFVNGADTLSFYSQNGKVSIVAHIYVKPGDAFILPMKHVKRIGVAEMSFDIPGMDKGRIFIQNPTSLSFEYRAYSQETIFIDMPARGVYVSGIVN